MVPSDSVVSLWWATQSEAREACPCRPGSKWPPSAPLQSSRLEVPGGWPVRVLREAVMVALSAPEEAGRVPVDFGEELLDGRGRRETLVPMAGEVPVPPVQRPLLLGRHEPQAGGREPDPLALMASGSRGVGTP